MIAHRLKTIMSSDKIMVIDDGKISEMDKPSILMKKTDSQFYSLWEKYNSDNQEVED